MKSRIGMAACLTMSLATVVTSRATEVEAVFPHVVDTTEWFPLSFEPVRKERAARPPRTDVAQPAPAPEPEIQVPAAVQNLRRTDH